MFQIDLGTRSKERRAASNKFLPKKAAGDEARKSHHSRVFLSHGWEWADSFQSTSVEPDFLEHFSNLRPLDTMAFGSWHDIDLRYKTLAERRKLNKRFNDFYQKIFDKVIDLYEHSDSFSVKLNRKCLSLSLYVGALVSQYNILPARIAKSEEGSIVFDINAGKNFYSIEIFNDEEIVFLKDINGEVNAISIAVEEVDEIINGLPN